MSIHESQDKMQHEQPMKPRAVLPPMVELKYVDDPLFEYPSNGTKSLCEKILWIFTYGAEKASRRQYKLRIQDGVFLDAEDHFLARKVGELEIIYESSEHTYPDGSILKKEELSILHEQCIDEPFICQMMNGKETLIRRSAGSVFNQNGIPWRKFILCLQPKLENEIPIIHVETD